MDNDYSLSNSVTVGDGGFGLIDTFVRKYMVGYYMYAFALIVVLSLVTIYFLLHNSKESFSAVPDIRNIEGIERLSAAPATTPTYYQSGMVDSGISIPTFTPDPNAATGAPGSLNYLVLNSPDLACNTRTAVGTDAWSWMTTNIGTPSTAATPSTVESFTDNALSRKSQGYN